MKAIFTSLFFIIIPISLFSQSQRMFASADSNNVVHTTNGIEGILEAPGEVIYVAESKFSNRPYCSFLKTTHYVTSLATHLKIPGTHFYPTSIVKIGQYIYVSAEYGSLSPKMYGLLKLSADDGTPILFKRIQANTDINPKIKLVQVPNSNQLMLSYHTISADSTSEIHFYTLDANLQATSFTKKIAFPSLKTQGYFATNDSYDFLMDGSRIYYNILFNNGNDTRFETGNFSTTSNTINASYSLIESTAIARKSKIAHVSNDSIFYLVDNSLFIHPANDSVISQHGIFIPNAGTNGIELKQLPNKEWMFIFQTPYSITGSSPVGFYNPTTQPDSLKIYYPTPSCSSIVSNGNNILVLGTLNKLSNVIYEFTTDNFSYCNPSHQYMGLTHSQTNAVASQAPEMSTATLNTTQLALPTVSIFYDGEDAICNPHHYSISENGLADVLRIYPNPATDFIQIQLENEVIRNVSIKTFTGASVYQSGSQQSNIDISGLASGIYLIEVRTEKATYTKKLIKQ